MIQFLTKLANWKLVLPFFLMTLWMSFVTFPKYEKTINQLAGQEVESLDGRLNYSYDEVLYSLETAGEAGRDKYAYVLRVVDMIFPLVYGLFFIFSIAFFINGAKPNSSWILMALVPLGAMGFDFFENLNTLSLLEKFPDFSVQQVSYGSMMTQTKWTFVALSAVLLIGALIGYISGKVSK